MKMSIIRLAPIVFLAVAVLGPRLISGAQTANIAADLDAVLKAGVQQHLAPGVVAVVADKDRIVYLGAAGQMNVRARKAMRTDAIFRIASMTKPVTAVAVMMLQEEGKLSVDDPVSKYLPAFKNISVIDTYDDRTGAFTTRAPSQELRIRHLLSNTSGFAYAFSNPTLKKIRERTGKATEQLPLLHDPGTHWTYGMSAKLVGQIVEKVSGVGLDQFFLTRIFKPLGLQDTFYIAPVAKMSRVPTMNHRAANGNFVEAPNPSRVGSKAAGDGGLLSTASDYAAFLQMLLNEGMGKQTRLLREDSVRAMVSNQIGDVFVTTQQSTDLSVSLPFPFGAGRDKFGFGFQIAGVNTENPNMRSAGSYSWSGSNNTHFWVDPVRGVAVVVMMETTPFYDEGAMKLVTQIEETVGRSVAPQ